MNNTTKYSNDPEAMECFDIEKLNEDAKLSFYYLKQDLNNYKLRLIYHKKETRHLIPYLITFYSEEELVDQAVEYSKKLKHEINKLEENMKYELSFENIELLEKFKKDMDSEEYKDKSSSEIISDLETHLQGNNDENKFKLEKIIKLFERENKNKN